MQRTIEAVKKHLSAIESPLYEVGVFFPASEKAADSKMLLRTWDEAAVLKSVPWLRAKNAEGAAIYVRPKGEHQYSLVDDLQGDAVARMRTEGFAPAIVIETSPANFQAWLNHGEVLEKRTSTAAARALAVRFGGDPGAADWRHFGRLAGFTNRKPAHIQENGLYPFVKVSEHSPGVYPAARDFIRAIHESIRDDQHSRSSSRPVWTSIHRRTIDDFRTDATYAGDGNRIDLAFAIHALAHGASETAVRDAIQSRDLSKKGSEARQIAYVDRTLAKARQHLTTRLDR